MQSLEQHLASHSSEIASDKIFFKPKIPNKKLLNAIQSYGKNINQKDVLILVDDTVWGSAKQGLLITENLLLFNANSYSGNYEISSLNSCSLKKEIMSSSISFNGKKCVEIIVPSGNSLSRLFQTLNEFVTTRARALQTSKSADIKSHSKSPISEFITLAENQNQSSIISTLDNSTHIITANSMPIESEPVINQTSSFSGMQEKLQALTQSLTKENRTWIISLLKEKAGQVSVTALRNDDTIISIATKLYVMLPMAVRLVINEKIFIDFMMKNRDQLMERIFFDESSVSHTLPVQLLTERIEPSRSSSKEEMKIENTLKNRLNSATNQAAIAKAEFEERWNNRKFNEIRVNALVKLMREKHNARKIEEAQHVARLFRDLNSLVEKTLEGVEGASIITQPLICKLYGPDPKKDYDYYRHADGDPDPNENDIYKYKDDLMTEIGKIDVIGTVVKFLGKTVGFFPINHPLFDRKFEYENFESYLGIGYSPYWEIKVDIQTVHQDTKEKLMKFFIPRVQWVIKDGNYCHRHNNGNDPIDEKSTLKSHTEIQILNDKFKVIETRPIEKYFELLFSRVFLAKE
jgi:hypothetical protein